MSANVAEVPMRPELCTGDVVHLFEAGLLGLGGALYRHETHDDRLYLRALLDGRLELGGGAVGRYGIALRVEGATAELAPYVHRPELGGGLVLVEAVGGALDVDLRADPARVAGALAEAMAYVAGAGPRRACVAQVRSAHELPGGVVLDLLDLSDTEIRDRLVDAASELGAATERVLDLVVEAFGHTVRDRLRTFRAATAFGLLGAAVDAARETRDPELRWRLEVLAGEVASVSTAAQLMGLHQPRPSGGGSGRGRDEEPVLA